MSGVTLDAGSMANSTATNGGSSRSSRITDETGTPVVIPSAALAQANRQPGRRARLVGLLRQPRTDVVALDRVDGTDVGRLLAASGTSDIAGAHFVTAYGG